MLLFTWKFYDYFLLELHEDFNEEIIYNKNNSGKLYSGKKIYCVINNVGEIEIAPTNNRIYLNSEKNQYEERK